MFDFFKKKQQIHDIHWDITTSEYEGKLLIRRVRSEIPKKLFGKRYKHLITLIWNYEPANNTGVPSSMLKTRMDLMENILRNALEVKANAVLAAVVTCNGKREWYWYANNLNAAKKIMQNSLHGTKTFKVTTSESEDSKWENYQKLHRQVNQ